MIAKAIKMERDQWEPNWSDMGSQDEPGHDMTRPDTTRHEPPRHDSTLPTRHDLTQPDTTRYDPTRPDMNRHGWIGLDLVVLGWL